MRLSRLKAPPNSRDPSEMLFRQTRCVIADNSGAKSALIIGIRGVKKIASIGSLVTVAIKDVRPHAKVKLGDVHRAVVVRIRKEIGRKDGRYFICIICRYGFVLIQRCVASFNAGKRRAKFKDTFDLMTMR